MADDIDLINSKIHISSNEIKNLIPQLISRIEYNKIIGSTRSNTEIEKLKDCEIKTITFLKEIELFVNIP
jgi:hypothetical protein